MFEKFDLDDFEPFLVKGIVSDVMVLSTLGRFLTNPKLFFKNENYALVVNFYKFFFEKREKLPTKDELILFLNKKEYKHAIDSVFNEIEHIDYEGMDKDLFLKSAERFIKERGIIQTMISVAGELEKGEINSSKVLEKFEQVCNITLDNEKGLDLYEDIGNILTALKEKKRTISTGFKSLDKYIDGGFYEDGKALYLFMAPPNKGKSLFLGNIACNIANQGKTVLLITLEMSELAYASRFCSQQTAIPFAELHLRTDEVKEKMKNKPGKIIIKEFPPSTITVPELKGWIKKHIVEKGIKIDALCIDYINLFDGPGNNLYEKLKGIAEHTRALSYWLSAPVVSLTQQNRSADGKKMSGLNSISESTGVSATADVIWEIFKNEEDSVMNFIRLGFAKNRYGPVDFSIVMKIAYDTLKIEDLEQEGSYKSTLEETVEDSLSAFLVSGNN